MHRTRKREKTNKKEKVSEVNTLPEKGEMKSRASRRQKRGGLKKSQVPDGGVAETSSLLLPGRESRAWNEKCRKSVTRVEIVVKRTESFRNLVIKTE